MRRDLAQGFSTAALADSVGAIRSAANTKVSEPADRARVIPHYLKLRVRTAALAIDSISFSRNDADSSEATEVDAKRRGPRRPSAVLGL